jgi:hypothetical protein
MLKQEKMKRKLLCIFFIGLALSAYGQTAETPTYVTASVEFNTSDVFLDQLYRAAERALKGNEKMFGNRQALIEGGGYDAIWVETQPMGGEMYAKRNMTAAMNNVLLFVEYQHDNGRFPGLIRYDSGKFQPIYTHLQGFCFPYHALNLFYWNKKRDFDYLTTLYRSFERYDNYLWANRDSDGDGCLELWCGYDTGEDNSNRFAGTKLWWRYSGEKAPNDPVFPIESMDMMSYSYDARVTLAKISALLGNGKEKEWQTKAKAVQDRLYSYLWDSRRGACYDRDCNNEFMPALQHNNLRAMYYGSFTQKMADRFVKEHLMNPEEFFTPFPLPSIAVNNPVFKNVSTNDWSGQPEGLTYQRAIRALENYGYFSEITVFGEKLIANVGKRNTFPQQFDPFTGEFSEADSRTDYGPTALSVLEYIARFYGIHVQFDEIYWGALGRDSHEITYVQHWDGDAFTVKTKDGVSTGSINGKEIFRVSNGVRVVTDWDGKVTKIINIKGKPLKADCIIAGKQKTIKLKPNHIYQWK